ncbi:hypothetical protein [Roseicyclus mahoneyensis]|jgi:cation diffusion facilitator CzcD-associated flavoprotein CzcO|uniref:trimethylamine monooxygenase n=1 Tax=Roseicyclus mahoneyensis TaxID=164332 RepID=A0A316GNW8_9RHOB|nr:flavin-binding monooxygenase-like protein [Roseicyclus mahoneyensis]
MDFPLPQDSPDYPSHVQLLRYFNAYATEFGLRGHIKFKTVVTKTEPLPDGRWRLIWTSGEGIEGSRVFDALCVASGHHHTLR